MQNTSAVLKAPQHNFTFNRVSKFLGFFKYEIIKILIFLLLFFACVFYVNAESKEYYGYKTTEAGKL